MFRLYGVFIFVLGLASLGAYLRPTGASYLYAFAACALVLEIIGENVTLAVAQAAFSPAVFKTVLLKLFSSDICGRIGASLLLTFSGRSASAGFFFSILWTILAGHLACIVMTGRVPAAPMGAPISAPMRASIRDSLEQARAALRFMFSNPLVRIGLLGFIWNRATKFSVEAVFYNAMSERYHEPATVASFVSWAMLLVIILSLVVQQTLVRKAQEKLSLGSLFGLLPIGIVLLSSIAFIGSPFWPVVFLYLFYQCGQRSIYLPVLRQLLLPTPSAMGHSIFFLVIIFSLLSNVAFTALMSAFKGTWGVPHYLGLLTIMGLCILYFATELDSSYIRNLWSRFKEFKHGEWLDFQWSEGIMAESPKGAASGGPNNAAKAILWAYGHSYDEKILGDAVGEHKRLIRSPRNAQETHMGLSVLYEAGLPEFDADLKRLSTHGDVKVVVRARRILKAMDLMEELVCSHLSIVNRKALKDILMHCLRAKSLDEHWPKLKAVLRFADTEASNCWIQILSWIWGTSLHPLVLSCIDEESGSVDFMPLAKGMYGQTYREAEYLREILLHLKKGGASAIGARPFIRERLDELRSRSFNIWTRSAQGDRDLRLMEHDFLHTLFLEEWAIGVQGESEHLLHTIPDICEDSERERSILVDMHVEFLKKSPFFPGWRSILSQPIF